MTAGQVFECLESCLLFSDSVVQDFYAGLRGNSDVTRVEIYAACHFPEISRIFNRLTVFTQLSPSAFEFIAQF